MHYLKSARSSITATALSCCLVTSSLAAESLPVHAQSATQMTVAANAFIATLDKSQRESTVRSAGSAARFHVQPGLRQGGGNDAPG